MQHKTMLALPNFTD